MDLSREAVAEEPSRSTVDGWRGWTLLEFGMSWCGHCQAAQAILATFVTQHGLAHMKIEDGRGRPLGRSFKVKLWPTLVLLQDGVERARVVRPTASADLAPLAEALVGPH